jgi:hypothetical protein
MNAPKDSVEIEADGMCYLLAIRPAQAVFPTGSATKIDRNERPTNLIVARLRTHWRGPRFTG